MSDKIIFRDLQVRTVLGNDSWERKKQQPLLITAEIHTSIASAGKTDKVTESVHYGIACKRATSFAESSHKLHSLEAFAEGIAKACLGVTNRALAVHIIARKPRALLHAEYAGVEIFRTRKEALGSWGDDLAQEGDETEDEFARRKALVDAERAAAEAEAGRLAQEDRIIVKALSLSTIIGVNLWERHYKQLVHIDLVLHTAKPTGLAALESDKVPRYRNFRTVVDAVTDLVEKSSYRTVEALATAIARTATKQCKVPKITVRVEKPSALVFAACSAVEITRVLGDYAAMSSAAVSVAPTPARAASPVAAASSDDADKAAKSGTHSAYIALGTNLGNRLENMHQALHRLNTDLPTSHVVESSFLYQTAPMYVTDQPAFLNAACLVKTGLEPLALLDELKRIEAEMGRDFGMYRNGPRIMDLDILFYDEIDMQTERLTIPHALLHERRFQLGPLCDIDSDLMHHRLGKTTGALFRHLTTHSDAPDDIVRVTPLRAVNASVDAGAGAGECNESAILKALSPSSQKETVFMGILNCTPDSFSDGGDFATLDLAVEHAAALIKSGADIIDIGGQSTRPGATQVGVDEEIRRVVPVIQRIRELGITAPISIDTFYAEVAVAALDVGADIVNDVSGGSFDAKMLPLVARRQCPYVMMHMRGDPSTMAKMNDYGDYGGDVVRGTRFELAQRVRAALDCGVPRWNIILDPGIGFAKEGAQNFEFLRRLPELTARNIRASAKNAAASLATGSADSEEGEEGYIDEDLATGLAHYPVLVGSSRKRFIGQATGKTEAKDRVWGTAATVTAAIQGGASIVRIHDVAEMVDVARVSDHIYRRK
ncbi:trifunctional dihydropteroate synthetase [Coemansia sp. RSA 2337]|nr:trifunctional dihydropteroate synthetase [Coemansia sp. S16]KAJ2352251.1 trifunctional dihydropteroate synthetase [Coemansia sp. RSA 2673]KAJ2465666.1 trifunctional dihydropteroate synthetase [Coemansia sp. RSA 2337]